MAGFLSLEHDTISSSHTYGYFSALKTNYSMTVNHVHFFWALVTGFLPRAAILPSPSNIHPRTFAIDGLHFFSSYSTYEIHQGTG
jgi:hypothetical protein